MLSTSTQRRTAASNKRLETSIGNLKMPKGTVFVTIHNTLKQLLIYSDHANIYVENSVVYALSKRRFALQSYKIGTNASLVGQYAFSLGN